MVLTKGQFITTYTAYFYVNNTMGDSFKLANSGWSFYESDPKRYMSIKARTDLIFGKYPFAAILKEMQW